MVFTTPLKLSDSMILYGPLKLSDTMILLFTFLVQPKEATKIFPGEQPPLRNIIGNKVAVCSGSEKLAKITSPA